MIRVFIFEDKANCSYDPLKTPDVYVIDINKEIEILEKENWSILNIQHQIIPNYREYYTTYDKNIFTIVAKQN